MVSYAQGTSTGGQTVIPATSAPTAQATSAPGQPTSAPAAAPTEVQAAVPAVAKVGDRVELNGTALTVVKVDRAADLGQFQKAKDGNEFLIAEVIVENSASADKIPYNPLYFKVKDSDGFEYDAEFTAGERSLKSGELAKGDKARGDVAFEVKKTAKGLSWNISRFSLAHRMQSRLLWSKPRTTSATGGSVVSQSRRAEVV